MDEDILFAILGDIQSKLSNIESEVSSIKTWMPGETNTTDIENKLDRIIELLEQLIDK